jgi:hypothetical protein
MSRWSRPTRGAWIETAKFFRGYPNAAVFARDVEREQLWLAEIDDQIAGMAAITTD